MSKDDANRSLMVSDRSATSSPSALAKTHSSSIPSSFSPRLEESRISNRSVTPVSLGAIGNFNNLDTPRRIQSGSSIMSLGSTTVEDSSMLRSVYRSSRHASVSDAERGLLDSYVTLHMSVHGKASHHFGIVLCSFQMAEVIDISIFKILHFTLAKSSPIASTPHFEPLIPLLSRKIVIIEKMKLWFGYGVATQCQNQPPLLGTAMLNDTNMTDYRLLGS